MIFYPSRLPSVLILYFQTEGGVVPAGVLHTSLSVFVGTLHLQAEQPLASPAVRHNAVRTGSQPGTPSVDEQTAFLNQDRVTQSGAFQSLQNDIITIVIVIMLIKFDMIITHLYMMTVPDTCRPPLPPCGPPSSWLWSGLSGPHLCRFH